MIWWNFDDEKTSWVAVFIADWSRRDKRYDETPTSAAVIPQSCRERTRDDTSNNDWTTDLETDDGYCANDACQLVKTTGLINSL